jgi:hypothetical protein
MDPNKEEGAAGGRDRRPDRLGVLAIMVEKG